MEPCSILELSSTVLKLSLKLYRFFKAIHDAPEEVHEYLSVFESIRVVFQDVKEYAEAHLRSAFFERDGIRLTVVEATLRDCELEFTVQLSYVEDLDPATASSFLKGTSRKTKWVLRKETLQGLTKKLEKLQHLLSLAVTTSTGRNEIFMREQLQSVSSDVRKVGVAQEAELAAREEFASTLQQFATAFQKRITDFMQLTAELHIGNDARLSDISESLPTEFITKSQSKAGASESAADMSSSRTSGGSLGSVDRGQTSTLIHEVRDTSLRNQSTREEIHSSNTKINVDLPTKSHNVNVDQDRKLSTSEIFNRALLKYRSSSPLAEDFLKFGIDQIFHRNVEAAVMQMNSSKRDKMPRNSSSLVDRYVSTLSTFSQLAPGVPSIAWGVRGLLLLTMNHSNTFSNILSSLQEMSEMITVFNRELVLYQDPRIISLIEQCYVELLEVLGRYKKTFSKSTFTAIAGWENVEKSQSIEKSMARIRQLSKSVLREADYQHLLEMREASYRLVEMQVQQRKILLAVEDQKRVLQSLQKERSIMNLVQEQQKMMQVVQSIQSGLQN